MNSLKRIRIWEERLVEKLKEKRRPDEKPCRLIVRIEETQTVDSSKPPTGSCKMRIVPPPEDEFGWPSQEPKEIELDAQAIASLEKAMQAMATTPLNASRGLTVQLRYQVTKELALTYEIPTPSSEPDATSSHYVIEDGRNRFVIGFEELEKLHQQLKGAIAASVA
jgi:hypothetical protein